MLIISQDLDSVAGYAGSGLFPQPAGIITTLPFYSLLSSAFPAYGARGQNAIVNTALDSVNWGAGPLNILQAAKRYSQSALVIGLNIAEGNQHEVWAKGGLAYIAVGHYDKHVRRLSE